MNEDLQFDRAEMPAQNLTCCRQCQAPLRDHYFQVSGAMLCDQCVDAVRQALAPAGSSAGRFARAFFFGGGAALVSAIAYGLWLGFTDIDFALITIAMGWFIGGAVRRGSGGRGGWRYGLLAVFLTYMAISFSYFGLVVAKYQGKQEAAQPGITGPASNSAKAAAPAAAVPDAKPGPGPAAASDDLGLAKVSPLLAVLALVAMSLAMPVAVASSNVISILIIGFGLWKAWSMNRAVDLQITGPHLIGDSTPAGA